MRALLSFILLTGLLLSLQSQAIVSLPPVQTNPTPVLSGFKNSSVVTLKWRIGSGVTRTVIEESSNGTSWIQVYSGLGQEDGGVGDEVYFFTHPDSDFTSLSFVAQQFASANLGGGKVCPGGCGGSTSYDRIHTLSGKSNTHYYYRAKNCTSSFSSSCSAYSSVFTVGSPPPSTPSSITTPSQLTTNKFSLTWAAVSGALHYKVEQQKGSSSWSQIYSGNNTAHQVTGLSNAIYRYRVRACNSTCSSWRTSGHVTVQIVASSDWKNLTSTQVDDAGTSSVGYLAPVNLTAAAVKGKASTSGGQASYQIPIELPPGRAGVQPSVSVSYSSQGGNGILGMGFGLNAGGSISRCGATFAQDGFIRAVTFNASTDRLCFNGQRLMNVSGGYGQSGTTYRTEMDSFVKVVQNSHINNSGSYFTVYYPNGHTATYGKTANSRFTPSDLSTPLTWKVTQESYSSGRNTINYRYIEPTSGEHLLEYIYYTGNASSDGDRYVKFIYEPRLDKRHSYMQSGQVKNTQRLLRIETYAGSNEFVSQHQFKYNYSQASNRSILDWIKRCGKFEGSTQCTTKTQLNWMDDESITELRPLGYDGVTMAYPNEKDLFDVIPRGDTNGDGSLDWPNAYVNAEGKRTSTNSIELTPCYHSQLSKQLICVNGDFNLDGKTDDWQNVNGYLRLKYTDGQTISTGIALPSANSTHNIESSHIANIADYNGDGWPDLMIFNNNNSQPQLKLHIHSKNPNTPYSSSGHLVYQYVTHTPKGSGSKALATDIQFIGDITGNGASDLMVVRTGVDNEHGYPQPKPSYILENMATSSSISFEEHHVSFLGQAISNYFSYFIDVNGDGLTDWAGWNDSIDASASLLIRLNKGNGNFTGEIEAGGDTLKVRTLHINNDKNPNAGSEIRRVPKYHAAFKVQDINNDGKPEILTPSTRLLEGCHLIGNSFPTPSQRMYCGEELYGLYYPSKYGPASINSSEKDDSIYQFDAIYFDVSMNGQIDLRRESTPYVGHAYQSQFIDAYGSGLPGLVFNHRKRPANSFKGDASGTGFSGYESQFGVYINRNYGSGAASTASDYQPTDYLESVTDGFGNSSEWRYRPLSTGEPSADNCGYVDGKWTCKMYLTDNEYEGDGYLHFSSSMYVVQSFKQSNGVGGENETEYAYNGAMYHTQGRGFTGFREIIEKDVQRDIVTRSQFEQKFPQIGLLTEQETKVENTVIRHLTNEWKDNPNHSISGVAHQFLKRSTLNTWDTNRTEMMRQITSLPSEYDIDQHGRVEKKQIITTDYIHGQQNTDTVEVSTKYFPLSPTALENWWLSKVETKTTETQFITRGWIDDPINGLDGDKTSPDVTHTSTVTFNWDNTHRKSTTITTSAKDMTTCQRIESVTLNHYGLPSSTTISSEAGNGCSSATNRTTSFTYTKNGTSSTGDGYFPYTITNAKGHATTSHYHIGFGQPTRVTTKITSSSELETTTKLDAIGRPIEVSTSAQPTQYLRYLLSSEGEHEPTHAKTLVQTKAMGTPDTEMYSDSLGRQLRTVTQGFAGEFRYTDKVYDTQGRLIKESLPYLDSQSPVYTEYGNFDALERPKWRRLPHGLESVYDYDGLTTSITVNGNRSMSRTYNSRKWLLETEDANGGTNRFSYDASGRPLIIEDAKGKQIFAYYNDFGHKYKVDDPNNGITEFKYNMLGELTWQEDANGVTQTNLYDTLGRVYRRTIAGGNNPHTATYAWDTRKYGMLSTETANGVTRNYYYDGVARINQTQITQSGKAFSIKPQYDSNYGRIKGLEYPNGLTLAYEYNDNGYLTHTKNAASDYVYREVTAMDWAGRITQAQMAEGQLDLLTLYDTDSSVMLSTQVTNGSGIVHAHHYELFDDYKNLLRERNIKTGLEKNYGYDTLNRLTSYQNSDIPTPIEYDYDATGNLLKKTDYSKNHNSAYRYGGNSACSASQNAGSNAVCRIEKLDNTTVYFNYDEKGNLLTGDGLDLTYNYMDKPLIVQRNHSQLTDAISRFTYASDGMRAKQVRTVSGKTTTTYYADKLYELDNDGAWRAYIDDIAVLSYTPDRKHQILYTLRDRLGSATTMVDHNGSVVSRRYFDPFGRVEDMGASHVGLYGDGMLDLAETNRYRRGFTDHEHLNEQRIIHMNGRVYDYNIGRFLSVDPLIQAPTSTQSINPYSYIMNNPMSGTDPTGYCSTDDTLKGCADGLEAGKTQGITDKDGNTVGHIGKDKDGNVHITNNGSKSGQAAISKSIGGDHSQIGSQQEIAKSGSFSGGGASNDSSTLTAMETGYSRRMERQQLDSQFGDGTYLDVTGDAALDAGIVATTLVVGPELIVVKYGSQIVHIARNSKLGIQILRAGNAVNASVPVEKFSAYIFKEGATHGKDVIFKGLGYSAEHSAQLAKTFETQGAKLFSNGSFTAGDMVIKNGVNHGQRITIDMTIKGIGAHSSKNANIRTGWMLRSDGSISLSTPFSGFAK